MKTKEQLQEEIQKEIAEVRYKTETTFSSEISDSNNRIAISNLYIALSNLIK